MKYILAIIAVVYCSNIFAQDSLQTFNNNRNHITLTGMKVLGTWGAANLGVGAIGWASSKNNDKYFYQMTTFWGAANLGIATLGYLGTRKKMSNTLNADENLLAQKKIESTFLVNGGLDFVYIGAGIYLNNRGNKRDDEKLKHNGTSVIMQGAFLLLFDGTMYSFERKNGNKLRKFLSKNDVTFTGNSIGVIHYF